MIQVETIKENITNCIESIMSYSSYESVVVLVHNDSEELNDIVAKNQKYLNNCNILYSKSGKVALILKNIIQTEKSNQGNYSNIIDFGNLPNWSWLINKNYKRVLQAPSQYPNYIIKIIKRIFF